MLNRAINLTESRDTDPITAYDRPFAHSAGSGSGTDDRGRGTAACRSSSRLCGRSGTSLVIPGTSAKMMDARQKADDGATTTWTSVDDDQRRRTAAHSCRQRRL